MQESADSPGFFELTEHRLDAATSNRIESFARRARDALEHALLDALWWRWPRSSCDRLASAFTKCLPQDACAWHLDAKAPCQLSQRKVLGHGALDDVGSPVPFLDPLLVMATFAP